MLPQVCRCGHQFCWLCLADDHGYKHTRDGRPCNKFQGEDAADQEQEASRANLARYAHYFERYRAHHQSQKIAYDTTLPEVKSKMEELQKVGHAPSL